MLVIGIVGSPAGGKSTVANRLRELGATWINADRIARRCLALASIRRQLRVKFGDSVLDARGFVDRRAVADRVFGDDAASREALDYLESVVHPPARQLVLRQLRRAARRGYPAAVIDAPMLLEADWGVMCDAIWCVDAPRRLREEWIAQRGWTIGELDRRERRQMEMRDKRRLSTHMLINEASREQLLNETEMHWDALMRAVETRVMHPALFMIDHCV